MTVDGNLTGRVQDSATDPGTTLDERQRSLPTGEELVQLIADKVYALWLAEARIEDERRRWPVYRPFSGQGGW